MQEYKITHIRMLSQQGSGIDGFYDEGITSTAHLFIGCNIYRCTQEW